MASRAAVLRAIAGGVGHDMRRGSGSFLKLTLLSAVLLRVPGRRFCPASSRPGPTFLVAAMLVLVLSLVPVMVCFWPERSPVRPANERAMPDLRAHALSKRFSGIRVVNDVNLTIRPGEVVGYLGPNGSGKTTTARMLAGLLDPSGGIVEYAGADIRDDVIAFRRCLGYVPEEPYLYPFLSGREYLQLVGRLRELPETSAHRQDRRLPAPVQSQRRGRSEHWFVLEGHAAEDRHLGGAAARSGDRDLRRAGDRTRCRDDVDAAPPGAHAGRARQGDSLQLAHPRSGGARVRPRHRAAQGQRRRGRLDRTAARVVVEHARSKACSRSWSFAKIPNRSPAIWPTWRQRDPDVRRPDTRQPTSC